MHSQQAKPKKDCIISLQKHLKQQYCLLSTQNQQKNLFQKKLSDIILTYYRNKIQSLAFNQQNNHNQPLNLKKITTINAKQLSNSKNKNNQSNKNIGIDKKYTSDKVLLEDEGFGQGAYYVKQLLLQLSKNPEFLITIIKKHQSIQIPTSNKQFICQTNDSIIKAIVHNFYQNIVDDDIYNKDIFLILEECFKLIIHHDVKVISDVKITDNFTIAGKIIKEYLNKIQIKNYSKQVIRNTVLEITKIDHEIMFNGYEDNDKQKKQTENLGTNPSKNYKNQNKKNQQNLKDQPLLRIKQNKNSKIHQYAQSLKIKDQKIRLKTIQNQKKQGINITNNQSILQKNKQCISKQLLNYLGITEQIQFPTFILSTANTELKKQEQINKQWAAMLSHKQSQSQHNQDIVLVKNIILIFFSDLFKMVHSLPLSLKIACKMLFQQLQKKFHSKKLSFQILAQYLLCECLLKNFNKDENMLQSLKLGPYMKNNMQIITKIIINVINNDYKNIPKCFEYEFNLIVTNLRLSLFNYFSEIVNIDLKRFNKIRDSKRQSQSDNFKSIQKIKSYSVCLSVNDVKELFQMIKNSEEQLKLEYKNDKLLKKVKRIQMVTSDINIYEQRKDKRTGLYILPQDSYVMYYQLQLPKQLSVNYIKYYEGFFKNNKLQKILKILLLSIKDLQNFVEYRQQKSFIKFLLCLAKKQKQFFDLNSSIHMQTIDNVPIEIKIKYLVNLIKLNFQQTQYEHKIAEIILKMYSQVLQRITYYKTIWDKSKQYYLKSLSTVIYLNQNIIHNDLIMEKNQKSLKLDQFIQKTKIAICITSPKTRQQQLILKTNMLKDLTEDAKRRIWLQNQSRCIHSSLNLQFIKTLTGEYDKNKKQYEAHCNDIMKFTDILCSLPEIKQNQADDIYVKETFYDFIQYCCDIAINKQQYSSLFKEDQEWLHDSMEQKLSKKIYDKLYPKQPTYEDIAFYLRLKTLDFINYEHLKIKPCHRVQQMWELACRQLKQIDKVKTPGQKLHCIYEFNKTIINSYYLLNTESSSHQQEQMPVTASDIYPILIYVLIKSAPKRIISNIKFIELFGNQNKLMSTEGYSFIQLKSAIQFCDELSEIGLEYEKGVTLGQRNLQFNRIVYEKEIQYGIYFLLLRRPSNNPETQQRKINFLINFIKQNQINKQNK